MKLESKVVLEDRIFGEYFGFVGVWEANLLAFSLLVFFNII